MIPKSWDNVTVEQFVLVEKTRNEVPANELAAIDLRIKRACYLTDEEPEDVMNWSMEELIKVDALMNTPLPEGKIINQFRLNGQLYTFRMNPNKLSADEYMTIMNTAKDSSLENLHKILFNIAQPRKWYGKKMTIKPEDVEKRIADFKQLPLKIANPIAVFFWTLSNNLTDAILDYSIDKMNQVNKTLREEIECLKDMDG